MCSLQHARADEGACYIAREESILRTKSFGTHALIVLRKYYRTCLIGRKSGGVGEIEATVRVALRYSRIDA